MESNLEGSRVVIGSNTSSREFLYKRRRLYTTGSGTVYIRRGEWEQGSEAQIQIHETRSSEMRKVQIRTRVTNEARTETVKVKQIEYIIKSISKRDKILRSPRISIRVESGKITENETRVDSGNVRKCPETVLGSTILTPIHQAIYRESTHTRQ